MWLNTRLLGWSVLLLVYQNQKSHGKPWPYVLLLLGVINEYFTVKNYLWCTFAHFGRVRVSSGVFIDSFSISVNTDVLVEACASR